MVDSIEEVILRLKQQMEALSRKKEAIGREIDEEIDKIEKAIEALENLRSANNLPVQLERVEVQAVKPIEAARRLFERDPKRKVYPKDVRDEFESLRKNGRLSSNAKDLLQTAHWAIRSLWEVGEIQKQKRGKGKEKWYRKARD
ncbi:MAG: hypothetical protein V1784_03215 [bacterium]